MSSERIDYTSSVPKYTFANTEKEQQEQLRKNPGEISTLLPKFSGR